MTDHRQIHHLVLLNEGSVARTIWLAMSGRAFTIFDVAPAISNLTGSLARLADWARARPNHIALQHLNRWRTKIDEDPNFFERSDLFHEIEPWIEERFGFATSRTDDPYTIAFRQLVVNFCVSQFPVVRALAEIYDEKKDSKLNFVGFSADTIALFDHLHRHCDANMVNRSSKVGVISKSALLAMAMTFGIAWVAAHLRWRIDRRAVFLMANYVACGNYRELVSEVERCGKSVALVPPAVLAEECARLFPDFNRIEEYSGRLTATGGLTSAKLIVLDGWRLFAENLARDPRLLLQLILCPIRRVKFRALFTRFPCQFFYSRDIYNVEHIMRTAELRRIGAVSLGVLQNLPSWTIYQATCRYVDFDIFYIIGAGTHRDYRDTWPAHMAIRPGVTLRIARDLFERAKTVPRNRDIAIFIVCAPDWRAMCEFTRKVAARFTDRKIIVKVKEGYRELAMDKSIRSMLSEIEPLVTISDMNSYQLMLEVGYAFSNPSTVIPELVQMGVMAFAIDTPGISKQYYYRYFPGLCVSDGDEAIERIEAIEAGRWIYPRDKYHDLVDQSGVHYVDIIKSDLGLAVEQPLQPNQQNSERKRFALSGRI